MQKAAIAFLLILLVWMGTALVRVENERYALYVGLCHSPLDTPLNPVKEVTGPSKRPHPYKLGLASLLRTY